MSSSQGFQMSKTEVVPTRSPSPRPLSVVPNTTDLHQPGPAPLPLGTVTELFKRTTLYIAIHQPILNVQGHVEDLSLIWWNDVYASVRTRPPLRGSLVTETYLDPEEVIELANTAWDYGDAHQQFVLDEERLSVYSVSATPTSLAVTWLEYDGKIVEIAEDLSQLRSTQAELEIRRLELADAHHHQQISQLRENLARNMHDSLIQQLFAIGIGIDSVVRVVNDPEAERLRRCQEQLQNTIDEIRQMVHELDAGPLIDPTEVQRRELGGVVEEMAMALGFTPEFHTNLTEVLSTDLRYDVIAVIREALANAARHSGADAVTVTVDRSRSHLNVAVSDNGCGFDTSEWTPQSNQTSPPTSHGLRNMAKRAQRLGGDLTLRSTQPGTEVIWSVPL
jgi:signal transduction histidine kinase